MAKRSEVKISTKDVKPVEMETLFWIDEVEYQIPKAIRPNIAIAYLRDVTEHGQEQAISKAMYSVMGESAMNALADCDAVTDDDMGKIMAIVSDKLYSTMRQMQGKSSREPRR